MQLFGRTFGNKNSTKTNEATTVEESPLAKAVTRFMERQKNSELRNQSFGVIGYANASKKNQAINSTLGANESIGATLVYSYLSGHKIKKEYNEEPARDYRSPLNLNDDSDDNVRKVVNRGGAFIRDTYAPYSKEGYNEIDHIPESATNYQNVSDYATTNNLKIPTGVEQRLNENLDFTVKGAGENEELDYKQDKKIIKHSLVSYAKDDIITAITIRVQGKRNRIINFNKDSKTPEYLLNNMNDSFANIVEQTQKKLFSEEGRKNLEDAYVEALNIFTQLLNEIHDSSITSINAADDFVSANLNELIDRL